MQQVFYEGQWQPGNAVQIPISNRSFRYGDGLFESFRWIAKKWAFAKWHWDRLQRGADLLKLQLPADFASLVYQALQELSGPHSCRLSIWRAGAGKYSPTDNHTEWLLEVSPSASNHFSINEKGLQIELGETYLTPNIFSSYKTNNALEYVLAGIEKQERQLDDLILLNCYGELVEACHSNLFMVTDSAIITPSLDSGCLNGTIRQALLHMPNGDLPIIEKTLFPQDLEGAKEIWLTNSLSGLRWVNRCEKLKFGHSLAKDYLAILNTLAIK